VLAAAGKGDGQQGIEGRLLLAARGVEQPLHLPLLELARYLRLEVFFETSDDQPFAGEILLDVILRIGDGGGVEHVHQTVETDHGSVSATGRHVRCSAKRAMVHLIFESTVIYTTNAIESLT